MMSLRFGGKAHFGGEGWATASLSPCPLPPWVRAEMMSVRFGAKHLIWGRKGGNCLPQPMPRPSVATCLEIVMAEHGSIMMMMMMMMMMSYLTSLHMSNMMGDVDKCSIS